ncbi:hypothetical protein GCM10022220_68230 [Actinocatenispora rupis]
MTAAPDRARAYASRTAPVSAARPTSTGLTTEPDIPRTPEFPDPISPGLTMTCRYHDRQPAGVTHRTGKEPPR